MCCLESAITNWVIFLFLFYSQRNIKVCISPVLKEIPFLPPGSLSPSLAGPSCAYCPLLPVSFSLLSPFFCSHVTNHLLPPNAKA